MKEMQNTVNSDSTHDGTFALPAEQKTPGVIVRRILTSLFLVLICGFLGALAGYYMETVIFSHLGTGGAILFIVTVILLFYVVIAIHECGHLLGGRIVGSRFMIFIAGPLRIIREQHGIRISLNKNLGAFGGLAGSMPQGENNLLRKMLVMVAGGPIASLLLAIVTATPALLAGLLPASVAQLLLVTAFLSTLIFLATIIPMQTGGLFTDGARILTLLRGGPAAERWSANILLQNMLLTGQLPRNWEPALLQKACALPDGSLDDIAGNSFAYYHALDTGSIAEAQKFLERQLAIIKQLSRLIRPSIALEAAYFDARYHANPEAARRWLKQAKGGIIDRCTRLRVEAAILLAEGKKDEARQCIQDGLDSIKDAMYAGTARLEEVWLKDLMQESTQYE